MDRLAPEQNDTMDGIREPAENPLLFGHHDVRQALVAAYRSGRLPHALLLAGPQGIGKATLAFHFANYLLAHPDRRSAPDMLPAPVPTSGLFRQIATGAHPGVLHLTRPLNDKTKTFKTALTVDEIRKINRLLSMTSHDGSYRIVIIDPADDMNANAANALLKNLEEPPRRTLFILIVNSPGDLLPTIRSRCQVVRMLPLAPPDLMAALETAGLSLTSDAALREALAHRAEGSVRQAIAFHDYGGLEITNALDQLVGAGKLGVAEAHRLADAVSGKDRAVQYTIFNDHGLALLDRAAVTAARQGDLDRAIVLADAWTQMRIAVADADTYNLDRKQHVLNMIFRLSDTFRM